jgi:hypothetical protein
MPIRPENRDRYPKNWPELSRELRFGRADGRCECTGQCGHRYRHRDHSPEGRCTALHGDPNPATGAKVILTVAHLDHTPENCDPSNLVAMCNGCHLRYDTDHHAQTAARTKFAAQTAGMDALFGRAGGAK